MGNMKAPLPQCAAMVRIQNILSGKWKITILWYIEEKLKKILEAAHVAPTAANLQPVRLIVVQSSEGLPGAAWWVDTSQKGSY